MDLQMREELARGYKSPSQRARVITEGWVAENLYCVHCGSLKLLHLPNNSPVGDFVCPNCGNEYELKSKRGSIGRKVVDGEYRTMIDRITSLKNPDLLVMNYSKVEYKVSNLFFIPKHFFVPEIIEKRKPLALTARRGGWQGCNILFGDIVNQGRIPIIYNGKIEDSEEVINKVKKSGIFEVDIKSRGWLMDVLHIVNVMPQNFSLADMYQSIEALKKKHPDNNHIADKIRQQLQILRDRGFIRFLGNGQYEKI